MKVWAVKTAYYYGKERPKDMLEMNVRLFQSEQAAIDELNGIIRDDWTTTIPYGDGEAMLADHPGAYDTRTSIRLSEYYYSKDKKVAWAFFSDSHGYKGEVSVMNVCEEGI